MRSSRLDGFSLVGERLQLELEDKSLEVEDENESALEGHLSTKLFQLIHN